mmetsp:Transcript_23302/g.34400  ORF Transcript_23302/g.34400 Transcript_23302/m.34400 type:complete len:149 (-) Transcript_23302:1-447(-)
MHVDGMVIKDTISMFVNAATRTAFVSQSRMAWTTKREYNSTQILIPPFWTCDMIQVLESASPEKTILQKVLTAYPEAAGVLDNDGRLPLHQLVSHSCNDRKEETNYLHPNSVLDLCTAFSGAVTMRDPTTGLLPVESAILGARLFRQR